MENLYNKIELLCKEQGLNVTQMCKQASISRGALSDLKLGRSKTLSSETLKKLSDFFQVSTDYLLGKTEQKMQTPPEEFSKPSPLTKKDERQIEKILEQIRVQLTTQQGLMFDGDPASPEAIESILSAMELGLQAAKTKNKEKYTPNKYKKGT